MTTPTLVLDANILIRAVLGQRVRQLLLRYGAHARFFAPESAYAEAAKHLPALLEKRGLSAAPALAVLHALRPIVQPLEASLYEALRPQALARIAERDPDDWPVLACALWLNCPIWTEDPDFFGTGVATWTSSRVELYLAPCNKTKQTDTAPRRPPAPRPAAWSPCSTPPSLPAEVLHEHP